MFLNRKISWVMNSHLSPCVCDEGFGGWGKGEAGEAAGHGGGARAGGSSTGALCTGFTLVYSNYLLLYLFSLHAHPHKGSIVDQLVTKGSHEESSNFLFHSKSFLKR
jgi:hypothetical protein